MRLRVLVCAFIAAPASADDASCCSCGNTVLLYCLHALYAQLAVHADNLAVMAAMHLIHESGTAHTLLCHHALQAYEACCSQMIPAVHHGLSEQAAPPSQQQWHDTELYFHSSSAAETYSGSHGVFGQERWHKRNLNQALVHAHLLLQSCVFLACSDSLMSDLHLLPSSPCVDFQFLTRACWYSTTPKTLVSAVTALQKRITVGSVLWKRFLSCWQVYF